MSDFFGLSIGLSALYAQRRAIDITGQNIANANTEGYSRQRVTLSAREAGLTASVFSSSPASGAGVEVEAIERIRDFFLEVRAATEHASASQLAVTQRAFSRMELVFAEPSDRGIQTMLADYWAGWHDVANRPNDLAARTQLLERARTLVTAYNQAAGDLRSQWSTTVDQMSSTVSQVNEIASQIAELNGAILRATSAELSPADLQDQRDLLVTKLAEMAGISIRQGELGTVNVYLNGTPMILGSSFERLVLEVPATTNVDTADTTPVRLLWEKDSFPATVTSGELAGLLDAVNNVLPAYKSRLDDVGQKLADVVNTQHALGFDLDGLAGGPMFTFSAATGLSLDVVDPRKVAAAGAGSGLFDGSNAIVMAGLQDSLTGPDRSYQSMIIQLGVDTQVANRRVAIQRGILEQVDAARDAESGVSLDEEMANLVAYQHAYEAAARFITAVDEMLDRLVNGTGTVGR